MNRSGKFHALLSTARVPNIPSVVSNVWLGVVMGMIHGNYRSPGIPWQAATCLALAGVSLYVGGNFLNDWADRAWDAKHRPERALPRGLFPPGLYGGVALALGLLGVAAAGWWSLESGMTAAVIVALIIIYTVSHKRSAWSVVPMGLCRALLPVMGFVAFSPYINGIWAAACGLFCYIMGLSLSARHESMENPPKRVALMARGLLLATAILLAWANHGLFMSRSFSVAGALPYLLWTSVCLRFRRRPISGFVSSLLAGIPLVDWMVLLPVSLTMFNGISPLNVACFTIPPLSFIFALLLQRLAPAT